MNPRACMVPHNTPRTRQTGRGFDSFAPAFSNLPPTRGIQRPSGQALLGRFLPELPGATALPAFSSVHSVTQHTSCDAYRSRGLPNENGCLFHPCVNGAGSRQAA